MTYDGEYFEKYRELDNTEMGYKLTKIRCDLVKRWLPSEEYVPVDIGIGGGAFVSAMNCNGFDVSNDANSWLKVTGQYVNPYTRKNSVLTFWDSLEHIVEFYKLLDTVQIGGFVFMSIPIFFSEADTLKSKHYKPGEHIWYFTKEGLINTMKSLGFVCLEANDEETKAGRENILSFAFIKTNTYRE